MAIPKITTEDIRQALKYIDENGIPDRNKSKTYELVAEDGKTYPVKYVIAVADHIANGTNFVTDGYNSVEAKNFLITQGFKISSGQEKYELVITADNVTSTDVEFSMDNIALGDGYKPLYTCFKSARGEQIERKYEKGERRNSNQTMPRLACQIFEKQIEALSDEEKRSFPVCKYTNNSELICGIFSSISEFRKYRNTIEYFTYSYGNGRQFVIYCWNIFSTIRFVQECLKRFGQAGDSFLLIYRQKDLKEIVSEQEKNTAVSENLVQQFKSYLNQYSAKLIESKNIIFRGAPGTGKSFLAKEIAADIVSNGYTQDYDMLSSEQKTQVEFVQFHPSYDYADFVEGLRPKLDADGKMGFELQDGIFKKFVDRARKNYENSQKPKEVVEKELSSQEALDTFFAELELGEKTYNTVNGNEFYITDVDDKYIYISIPENAIVKTIKLKTDKLLSMLESGEKFNKIRDITKFFNHKVTQQENSYYFVLYNEISKNYKHIAQKEVKQEELKKYIFIIDEINRGDISKIFGELFFAIDPGYRGRLGEVSTQFSNLHSNPNEKFYIPENVYIIGTMNDIDRSVDSFDFAMRRRFRFVELKADENLEMLATLEDEKQKEEAICRMTRLNKAILDVPDLNENYQIGASYFLKLKTLNFDDLWTDYLKPLLQEYTRGMYEEKEIMQKLAKAYGYGNAGNDSDDTDNQN